MFLAETKWLSRLRQTSESSRCHILIARRNEITRKVVVVNDDQLLRASMAGSLGANEYEVSTASDGYDALWQLKHGLVDLIISDLEIPGMPGREFLSVIRRRFPEILVIALDETNDGEVEPSVAHVLLRTIGLH